uniref:Uncharacterized protein n=1 Tax=Arundo donax TaxID=35708 RepID=A0A0A9H2Z1_ARUDO
MYCSITDHGFVIMLTFSL